MQSTICNDLGTLEFVYILKTIYAVIMIVAPILTIILTSVDLFKVVTGSENEMKKNYKNILKRIIICVVIFLLPIIVNIIMITGGRVGLTSNKCWINANDNTIAELRIIKKAEEEKAKIAAAEALAEKKRKEALENDKSYQQENNTSGNIKVIDGIFYKPKGISGLAGSRGTGPYGYNITFWDRLKKFTNAAAAAGYFITPSTSGWRSFADQISIKKSRPDFAATPGTSNHGWAIASDLSYGNRAATDWAHINASKYDLKFSVCINYFGGNCLEPWHIQPIVIKTY